MSQWRIWVSALLLSQSTAVLCSGAPLVTTLLDGITIDAEGDRNVFATPFDVSGNALVTVHVEPSTGQGRDGVNLRTVVRLGVKSTEWAWRWTTQVIEGRTLLDPWHTQASVAFDRLGYVHIAYNMHNMPWQYVVSRRPYDIGQFEFKGQALSQAELEIVKFDNKTPFPDVGGAAIPGNQVTYPMFFKDRLDDLYVTYRFALRPARTWLQRGFAGGIAKYDAESERWQPIGGTVGIGPDDARLPPGQYAATQRPLIFEDGHTVYLPTLVFDPANRMHVFWNWRSVQAGVDTVRPSHAMSVDKVRFTFADGSPAVLPLGIATGLVIGREGADEAYYAPKTAAVDSQGNPMVVLHSIKGGRSLWRWNPAAKRFAIEPLPQAAPAIMVDSKGHEWAVASGINVYRRTRAAEAWQLVAKVGEGLCDPRVREWEAERSILIHAKSCDGKRAYIYRLRP